MCYKFCIASSMSCVCLCVFFFFKQKTAYEMRISDWSSDVCSSDLEAYRALAQKASEVFRDYGATRVVEAWGDEVPDGKVTDYARAAHRQDGENVVYSWVEWPDKETRAKGWEKMMSDERMKNDPATNPFDGARMTYGGFAPIVEA